MGTSSKVINWAVRVNADQIRGGSYLNKVKSQLHDYQATLIRSQSSLHQLTQPSRNYMLFGDKN